MSMSKKDYESIAEVLSQYRSDVSRQVSMSLAAGEVAERLATMMGSKDSTFKRETFLDACRPSRSPLAGR